MKTKKLTFLASVLIIFLSFGKIGFAEENDKYLELKSELAPLVEELETNVSQAAMTNCLEVLNPLFDIATLEFLQFLDTHYSNKASTSSLNNIAIMRFMEYKRYINGLLDDLEPKSFSDERAMNLYDEYKNLLVCNGLGAAYIELSKEKMFEYVRTNVYVKKATIATETLAPINEEMRELLFSFTKMYSYFLTFKDKLPGFLSECITK